MADQRTQTDFIDTSPGMEDHVGSSDFGNSNSGRGDRSRRSWSDREEATLILALKDLVATGWKSDNGFRSGYLARVEETMRREIPKTDLKQHPHLQSKISTWKKNYSSLLNILDRSGVGFNVNDDFKIDCDDEQWSQIVKKDNNARYMRNKSWPHLEDWKEIFGKDRAAGHAALGTGKAAKEPYVAPHNLNDDPNNDYYVNLDDINLEGPMPDEVLPETEGESRYESGRKSPTIPKKQSKKRKSGDPLEGILQLMTSVHKDTHEVLTTLSTRIGYEFDQSTKRAEVFELLGGIPGLTLKQQFYVTNFLVKEPELMDVFRALSEIARPAYVMYLLELEGLQ